MQRSWLVLFMGVVVVLCGVTAARPRSDVGYRDAIDAIAKDVSTPEKRAQVIAQLMAIATDEKSTPYLRYYAGLKLGELGAVEAKDTLYSLAHDLPRSDGEPKLKDAFFLAYWMIKVAEVADETVQIELLRDALYEIFDGIIADRVRYWAVDELANRGALETLPEIEKMIRERDGSARGEEQIWLCTIKMVLLNTSATRQEALVRALAMIDTFESRRLHRWAIQELGKLDTTESLDILMAYARALQNYCYDEDGRWLPASDDPIARSVHELYALMIDIFLDHGRSIQDMQAVGIDPTRFFRTR